MAEYAGDYEWRGEGDGAEVILYAPEGFSDSAFERALTAARLPGVESPVYAAASSEGFGWVAASSSHVAPDLVSIPARGVLLTADAPVDGLDVPPRELPNLIRRRLAEVRLPSLDGAGVRSVCEEGALRSAEDGLIEEEDLPFFGLRSGDPDSLGRRAITAGERDWTELPADLDVARVTEVLDTEGAETLGIEAGALALVARVGAGDLGRLALAAHRERILGRVRGDDFGADEDLPAAPAETEEAADLTAALGASAGFADGRAALAVYALRRTLGDVVGALRLRAAWTVGGVEHGERVLHRRGLAAVAGGEVLATGSGVVVGTGKMRGSAPPFGVTEFQGRWPWEEAGLLERLADLGLLEG